MLRVTRDQKLTTAITGSYPRPLWYDVNLHGRSFKSALGDSLFRRIANINALRRRAPPSWPRTRDIASQTRTPAGPGAAVIAHMSGLLAGRASRPG
jgi:hypothetical protein